MSISIGERIRAARKACGITQAQLADEVGCSEPAIRLYELGKRTPKREILKKIAKSLGVEPQSLAGIEIASARDALEMLFRMEGEFGLTPRDDGSLAIDPNAKGAQKIDAGIKVWASMRNELQSGNITLGEYEAWKAKYR